MIGLSVPPLAIFFRHPPEAHRNKDYDIWYAAGQRALHGEPLYVLDWNNRFEFLYPPPAATLLAPLSIAGPLPCLASLLIINSLAWIACLFLGVYLATGRIDGRVLLAGPPLAATVAYVSDMYLLGQPNLVLLAMILGGFACLRHRRWSCGGALFALATAIKAFPVLVVAYLVWRREWKASVAMCGWLATIVFLLPAPVRGFQQNLVDLGIWADGMFSYDAERIAQRPGVTYGWKNQSLIGTAHRLLRHVPADHRREPPVPPDQQPTPIYANVADLSFNALNGVILGVSALLGLIFVASLRPTAERTHWSDAVEIAMLLVLMTVASPISWFYYGVWLLFPFTVITAFLLNPESPRRERQRVLALTIVSLVLLNFVWHWGSLQYIRAVGLPFFGYMLLFGILCRLSQLRAPEAAPRILALPVAAQRSAARAA